MPGNFRRDAVSSSPDIKNRVTLIWLRKADRPEFLSLGQCLVDHANLVQSIGVLTGKFLCWSDLVVVRDEYFPFATFSKVRQPVRQERFYQGGVFILFDEPQNILFTLAGNTVRNLCVFQVGVKRIGSQLWFQLLQARELAGFDEVNGVQVHLALLETVRCNGRVISCAPGKVGDTMRGHAQSNKKCKKKGG